MWALCFQESVVSNEPDFVSYSTEELIDSYNSIDKNAYPERYIKIKLLLEGRNVNVEEQQEHSDSDSLITANYNLSSLKQNVPLRLVCLALSIYMGFDIYESYTQGVIYKNGTAYDTNSTVFDLRMLKLGLMCGCCFLGSIYPYKKKT